MKGMFLIRLKGHNHKNFTGAIIEDNEPTLKFRVSCKKNGRKYLREANYHERKRLYKFMKDNYNQPKAFQLK